MSVLQEKCVNDGGENTQITLFYKKLSCQTSKSAGNSKIFAQFPIIFTLYDNQQSSKQKIRGSQSDCSLQPIRKQHSVPYLLLCLIPWETYVILSSVCLTITLYLLTCLIFISPANHSTEDKIFGLKINDVMSIFIKILCLHQMYLIVNHWKIQKPLFDWIGQYLLLWLLLAIVVEVANADLISS